jgi:hypothetical protein
MRQGAQVRKQVPMICVHAGCMHTGTHPIHMRRCATAWASTISGSNDMNHHSEEALPMASLDLEYIFDQSSKYMDTANAPKAKG